MYCLVIKSVSLTVICYTLDYDSSGLKETKITVFREILKQNQPPVISFDDKSKRWRRWLKMQLFNNKNLSCISQRITTSDYERTFVLLINSGFLVIIHRNIDNGAHQTSSLRWFVNILTLHLLPWLTGWYVSILNVSIKLRTVVFNFYWTALAGNKIASLLLTIHDTSGPALPKSHIFKRFFQPYLVSPSTVQSLKPEHEYNDFIILKIYLFCPDNLLFSYTQQIRIFGE